MQSIYTSYKCRTCKKEFVALTEEVEEHKQLNKYLVCPYCSSKRLTKESSTDNLKECMGARAYRRVNGAIKEIK